jgi:hypothetical protein
VKNHALLKFGLSLPLTTTLNLSDKEQLQQELKLKNPMANEILTECKSKQT